MFDVRDYQLISPAGHTLIAGANVIRGADATPFTAGDIYANAGFLNKVDIGPRQPSLGGYITAASAAINKLSITPRLRLWFFSSATPAGNGATNPGGGDIPVDNANYPGPKFADSCMFYLDLPAMVNGGDGSFSSVENIRKPVMAAADGLIYMLVQTLDAFTPDIGEQCLIRLTIERG